MYTVIGGLDSRTFRVVWLLEELGQRYTHRPEAPRSEAVRALSPAGKIPLLLEGEAVLTDSTAILHHLADRHGALTHPAGSLARARQDALTFALLDELEGVLWAASRHSFVLPEERRVPAVKDSLRWEFARNIAAFEARMGAGPWLMGEVFTVPDILLAHIWRWSKVARFEAEAPAVAAHAARCAERPAFVRTQALARPPAAGGKSA